MLYATKFLENKDYNVLRGFSILIDYVTEIWRLNLVVVDKR